MQVTDVHITDAHINEEQRTTQIEEQKLTPLIFRAVNQYLDINIIQPTESDSNKGFVKWGENNDYPQYLDSLYRDVATLQSIIEGTVDFITGNEVHIDDVVWNEKINDKDELPEDLVRSISRDILKYGGFAINVIRNRAGRVGSLYYIPFERIRSNEDNTEFYYSKDWSKSVGRVKFTKYPKFDPNKKDGSSIFYYSNNKTNTYPTPIWSAACKSAEIEKQVNEYHLNSIANGFSASYLISLNNGIPNEEIADEIEESFIEKFTGSGNGGRLVISFANDKEHSAELNKLDVDDSGERYKSLIERARQQLFTAFRANPNLFGIPTENNGFNQEEYDKTFKLYNRTTVRPIQKIIAQSLNYILDKTVSITPFSIDDENRESDVIQK